MNMKGVLLFLLILVILAGIPISFAQPQYVSSLNAEYGVSSCGTCHINPNGRGPLNDYGTSFKNQPNYVVNTSEALKVIGAPPTENQQTATPEATATLTTTPAVTTVTATGTPKSPGFGIVLALIGLFAWAIMAKRNKK